MSMTRTMGSSSAAENSMGRGSEGSFANLDPVLSRAPTRQSSRLACSTDRHVPCGAVGTLAQLMPSSIADRSSCVPIWELLGKAQVISDCWMASCMSRTKSDDSSAAS
jgi:hypothetical protein